MAVSDDKWFQKCKWRLKTKLEPMKNRTSMEVYEYFEAVRNTAGGR
jgi:NTP pyrophosphatase (non-canonical NTP hydrolase)